MYTTAKLVTPPKKHFFSSKGTETDYPILS